FETPRPGWIAPIGLDESPLVLPVRDDLRFAVAIRIKEGRRFAFHTLENKMLFPKSRRALRVLIPEGLVQVDASEDEDVRPSVSVEVMHVGEHTVGRTRGQRKLFGGIEFMLRFEVRSLIPERPGDDVHFAVAIEVAHG